MSNMFNLDPGTPVCCNNCLWKGTAEDALDIADLTQRISPGESVPAGECPNCGGLASLVDEKAATAPTSLLEDVAAIAALFHQHRQYEAFYRLYGPTLSGFPGLWQFCIFAAQRFCAHAPETWDSHDWIASLDTYIDAIYAKTLDSVQQVQTTEFLDPLAQNCMVRS